MRTTKIITLTLLLATLATGCSKDKKSPIRLFSERFTSDSKVLIDPDQLQNGADWVVGETMNVNGQNYTIDLNSEGSVSYYCLLNSQDEELQIPQSEETYYALYPNTNTPDADVYVINGATSGNPALIGINRLGVRFMTDGQRIAFPMAAMAQGSNDDTRLFFRHLSAGFKVTINNNTINDTTIASIRIVAQSDQEVSPLAATGLGYTAYAVWVPQGPSVPFSEIGGGQNYDAKYCSDMMFDLYEGTSTTKGKMIEAGEDLTFCVPVTINRVKSFAIIGYDANGVEIFRKYKEFGTGDAAVPVQANKMYNIPAINIGSAVE